MNIKIDPYIVLRKGKICGIIEAKSVKRLNSVKKEIDGKCYDDAFFIYNKSRITEIEKRLTGDSIEYNILSIDDEVEKIKRIILDVKSKIKTGNIYEDSKTKEIGSYVYICADNYICKRFLIKRKIMPKTFKIECDGESFCVNENFCELSYMNHLRTSEHYYKKLLIESIHRRRKYRLLYKNKLYNLKFFSDYEKIIDYDLHRWGLQ